VNFFSAGRPFDLGLENFTSVDNWLRVALTCNAIDWSLPSASSNGIPVTVLP
jgi:hypothetical protein